LCVGDVFLDYLGNAYTLDGIAIREDSVTVYNFEVAGTHTYTVSNLGVLVHNDECIEITIDSNKYPESAQHLRDSGYNNKLVTVDRVGAAQRRKDALSGTKTQLGKDRDEMPPAVFQEGSQSVRHISRSDNRGAGASIGNQLRKVPDGIQVRIITDP